MMPVNTAHDMAIVPVEQRTLLAECTNSRPIVALVGSLISRDDYSLVTDRQRRHQMEANNQVLNRSNISLSDLEESIDMAVDTIVNNSGIRSRDTAGLIAYSVKKLAYINISCSVEELRNKMERTDLTDMDIISRGEMRGDIAVRRRETLREELPVRTALKDPNISKILVGTFSIFVRGLPGSNKDLKLYNEISNYGTYDDQMRRLEEEKDILVDLAKVQGAGASLSAGANGVVTVSGTNIEGYNIRRKARAAGEFLIRQKLQNSSDMVYDVQANRALRLYFCNGLTSNGLFLNDTDSILIHDIRLKKLSVVRMTRYGQFMIFKQAGESFVDVEKASRLKFDACRCERYKLISNRVYVKNRSRIQINPDVTVDTSNVFSVARLYANSILYLLDKDKYREIHCVPLSIEDSRILSESTSIGNAWMCPENGMNTRNAMLLQPKSFKNIRLIEVIAAEWLRYEFPTTIEIICYITDWPWDNDFSEAHHTPTLALCHPLVPELALRPGRERRKIDVHASAANDVWDMVLHTG